MDIHRIIRDLNEERKHLDRIIESLELVAKTGGGYIKPPGRRGRKFMDVAGRQEVSIRMKKYWAGRREAKARLAEDTPGPESPERNRMDEAGFPVENLPQPVYA